MMEPEYGAAIQVGAFVLTAVFLLGGALILLRIIDHFRGKPPNHEKFVAVGRYEKERCECQERLDGEIDQLRVDLDKRSEEGKRGRAVIHKNLRKVEDRTSRTEALTETINQRQIQDSGQLARILHELGEVRGALRANGGI